MFECSGIDLDNQIIAENGFTWSVPYAICMMKIFAAQTRKNSSRSHPILTASEAILWLNHQSVYFTRILTTALEELDELTLDAFRRKYEALAIEARRALAEGQKDTNTPEA